MPYTVHRPFKTFIAQRGNGALSNASAPNVYFGLRVGKPLATDTMTQAGATGDEVAVTSYARKVLAFSAANFPDSSSGTDDWLLQATAVAFAAFTGSGAQPNATHVFMCDTASGTTGNLYMQAPLNPYATPLATTTTGTTASGQAVINLTSVTGLNANDYLLVDTLASGQQEWLQILSIASLAVTMTTNFAFTHTGSGIIVSQDGLKRTYGAGATETISNFKIPFITG